MKLSDINQTDYPDMDLYGKKIKVTARFFGMDNDREYLGTVIGIPKKGGIGFGNVTVSWNDKEIPTQPVPNFIVRKKLI